MRRRADPRSRSRQTFRGVPRRGRSIRCPVHRSLKATSRAGAREKTLGQISRRRWRHSRAKMVHFAAFS